METRRLLSTETISGTFGDDVIELRSVGFNGWEVTINGEQAGIGTRLDSVEISGLDGNDTLIWRYLDDFATFTVSFDGGSGSDQFIFDDTSDRSSDGNGGTTFEFTNRETREQRASPSNPGLTGLVISETIESITFQGGPRPTSFFVRSMPSDLSLTLEGNGGPDTLVVGGENASLDDIEGDIVFNGGEGGDAVVIDDRAEEGNDDFVIGNVLFADAITKPGTDFGSLSATFHESLELLAGSGNNTFSVAGLGIADLAIDAGEGDDIVDLGDGELGKVLGVTRSVDFKGGQGFDTARVDDSQAASRPVDYYQATATALAWSSDTTQRQLSYDADTEAVELFTSAGNDVITSEATRADRTVFGGFGDDTLIVSFVDDEAAPSGSSGGLFDGGPGTDTLFARDVDRIGPPGSRAGGGTKTLGQEWSIGDTRILRDGFIAGSTEPGSVEVMRLDAFRGRDDITLTTTAALQRVDVEGGEGIDVLRQFISSGQSLTPLITFDGGLPDASPGDSIEIVGTSGSQGGVTFTPDATDTSAGRFVLDGAVNTGVIEYIGVEPDTASVIAIDDVRFVTPDRAGGSDAIQVVADGTAASRIIGTTDGVALQPLRVENVANLTIDVDSNDPPNATPSDSIDVIDGPPGVGMVVTTGLTVTPGQDPVFFGTDERDVVTVSRPAPGFIRIETLDNGLTIPTPAGRLTLEVFDGDDDVIVDFAGGDPLPPDGLFLDMGGGFDAVSVIGSHSDDDILVNGFNTMPDNPAPGAISLVDEESLLVDASQGHDLITLTGIAGFDLFGQAAGPQVVVNAGPGDDTIRFDSPTGGRIRAIGSVDGDDGNDTLELNGQSGSDPDDYFVAANRVTTFRTLPGTNWGDVAHDGVETLRLFTGTNDDRISIGGEGGDLLRVEVFGSGGADRFDLEVADGRSVDYLLDGEAGDDLFDVAGSDVGGDRVRIADGPGLDDVNVGDVVGTPAEAELVPPGGVPNDLDEFFVGANSLLRLSGGGGENVVRTRAVDIEGTVDLGDDTLIFTGDVASPAAFEFLRDLLESGYNGGTWDGDGFASSANAATTVFGHGFAGAADAGFSSFAGVPLDPNAIIVRQLLYGDADLNRTVDLADFGRLRSGFGSSGFWAGGDFNYDGTADLADFGFLRANFGLTLASDASLFDED
ncbi:MAG: hypothetical protein AAF561_09805 [Planctomycetota bacterium]